MNEPNFIIAPWSFGHPFVEAWTVERLQYESSRPTQRALRIELAAAVRSIDPADALLLDATYASQTSDFVDTENVLFYNVGTAAFSRVATNGLRFERVFAAPHPRPPPHGWPRQHSITIAMS